MFVRMSIFSVTLSKCESKLLINVGIAPATTYGDWTPHKSRGLLRNQLFKVYSQDEPHDKVSPSKIQATLTSGRFGNTICSRFRRVSRGQKAAEVHLVTFCRYRF